MNETIHDVKKWLEVALAAVFLDAASQQARGHTPYAICVNEKHEGEGDNIGPVFVDYPDYFPRPLTAADHRTFADLKAMANKFNITIMLPSSKEAR